MEDPQLFYRTKMQSFHKILSNSTGFIKGILKNGWQSALCEAKTIGVRFWVMN
jgi:hypothetical protein